VRLVAQIAGEARQADLEATLDLDPNRSGTTTKPSATPAATPAAQDNRPEVPLTPTRTGGAPADRQRPRSPHPTAWIKLATGPSVSPTC